MKLRKYGENIDGREKYYSVGTRPDGTISNLMVSIGGSDDEKSMVAGGHVRIWLAGRILGAVVYDSILNDMLIKTAEAVK